VSQSCRGCRKRASHRASIRPRAAWRGLPSAPARVAPLAPAPRSVRLPEGPPPGRQRHSVAACSPERRRQF
jgi:hypothetical protein